jgi:sigma54-dependent transcription regulator
VRVWRPQHLGPSNPAPTISAHRPRVCRGGRGNLYGAFTGAAEAKLGLLESAQGGTIFLDEVGELAPRAQAKLLRAIESREVLPVGGPPRSIDVRFLAATNRDLEGAEEAVFRRDLCYRLAAVRLHVPALRERPAEIEPLAERFLAEACARFERGPLSFSPQALAALRACIAVFRRTATIGTPVRLTVGPLAGQSGSVVAQPRRACSQHP